MKEIKKLLARQSDKILPDETVKENIRRELGMEETGASLAYAHGGEKTEKRNVKKLLPLFAALLAVVVLLCVLLPVFLNRQGGQSPVLDNKFDSITDADSFYAYGAASVGAILDSAGTGGTSPQIRTAAARSSPEQGQIDTINRYLSLAESLLSDGSIVGESIAGGEGYGYGMNVLYTDLLGNTVSYTLYYDKEFLSGETDEEEREENYAITGVLLLDENTQYPVEGNYQTETDGEESENELYFKAYTNAAKTSYIEVRQEHESETEDAETETETEYVYSVYAQGALTERIAVEYESEEGELELKMTITGSGVRDELTFRSGTDSGESVLFASGTVNGESVRFRVYIREGKYHYVFEDGSSSDHDRYDDDDEDDDD